MTPQLAGRMSTPSLHRRPGFWRGALNGLTPQIAAIVAALLFARALSWAIFSVELTPDIVAGFWNLSSGFTQLLVTTAPMLLAIVVVSNLGPQRGATRAGALALGIVLGSCIGVLLRLTVFGWFGRGPGWGNATSVLLTVWPRYALLGGMLTVALEFHRREVASIAALQQVAVDRAALERQMAESRLQVLQAQIEPHFLFNTLANVRRLYVTEPSSGRTMLDNLMRYLETALPRMRETEATLGREGELADAYLQIQQIRMGRRLVFDVGIPAQLRAHPVPPMMLLTLIENAVKHGVSPAPQGGAIRVTARAQNRQLLLTVADSGVGFEAGSGAGTGLANIRARLAAQFGHRASLALTNNELGGATATIALPLSDAGRVA